MWCVEARQIHMISKTQMLSLIHITPNWKHSLLAKMKVCGKGMKWPIYHLMGVWCYTLLVWCSMQGIWVLTQQRQEGIVVSMIISVNEYLIWTSWFAWTNMLLMLNLEAIDQRSGLFTLWTPSGPNVITLLTNRALHPRKGFPRTKVLSFGKELPHDIGGKPPCLLSKGTTEEPIFHRFHWLQATMMRQPLSISVKIYPHATH